MLIFKLKYAVICEVLVSSLCKANAEDANNKLKKKEKLTTARIRQSPFLERENSNETAKI